MEEKLALLESYREGKLSLPPEYTLEHGAEALLLRREDRSVAAVFGVEWARSSDASRTAFHDD